MNTITPDQMTKASHATGARNWRQETHGSGITWLWLDCEGTGTNVISEAVLRELDMILDRMTQDLPKALVIRSAKTKDFAAGADIDGFASLQREDTLDLLSQGHAVLDKMSGLAFPTIAVIDGAALGGGFELALAYDHRIGVEGASVGFPEIQLGLHPGLGGTFRLTSLIDPVQAMKLMLTGKTAHTEKAKSLGIFDAVVPDRHIDSAVLAAAHGDMQPHRSGLKAAAFTTRPARSLAGNKMRSESEKRAPRKHYPAPFALIDLWENHGGDTKKMQDAEIASFATLLESATAQNLIRIFFLRRDLKKASRGDANIRHVHVIGAGTMGAEIAAWCALKGKPVTLQDVDLKPLGEAVQTAQKVFEARHLSEIEARDAHDRMMPDPSGLGVARADLIIEAAPEHPELKEQIYAGLKTSLKRDAILATNTSSLQLETLAASAPVANRFAGLHFFNPASKMMLVEVVSHKGTDPEVTDRLASFVEGIGKLAVEVNDYPGFLVNRILTPYLMEAMVLLDEGNSKEEIDHAALDFGMPMGPLTLADQIGLDVCLHVGDSLRANLAKPMPEAPEWLLDKVRAGETGKKANKGIYDWSDGTPNSENESLKISEDMIDRLILPMCDAAVECLRMGVVQDRDTVDAAMILGTGWAPFRGGPMHYAHIRGETEIRDRLNTLAKRFGDRFSPDAGWKDFT
ncbi:3-hydroxyacyl-CoA dehydrogenase NAD-binding domain-containing protein [Qingshengfaniella alkalisoli]|uniref:enoyl-CoA hydratase n=1 Tax=Qingshengfaniella alkalisoli TaxID=2599296 RepID=A0A5B8IZZ9_9RHOB|nr:3-hydroxyacyl-CoA dehydrogenase NAD-binding domain-containing protein [Qingshengfaniella alkalisoli]QDY71123.1 fatty-acid oxidation protein subunit alpha [Qingshengfaniella alkalisoli]